MEQLGLDKLWAMKGFVRIVEQGSLTAAAADATPICELGGNRIAPTLLRTPGLAARASRSP